MILTIDPMPALRIAKAFEVDNRFNTIATNNLHRDHAYAQKRQWAMTNDNKLSNEAALRGITIPELSALILSKPDIVADRELRRQQIKKRIDDAKTPEELDAI